MIILLRECLILLKEISEGATRWGEGTEYSHQADQLNHHGDPRKVGGFVRQDRIEQLDDGGGVM